MRVAVISDIHANLAAFKALLNRATMEVDEFWCLGDLVGYGPDPDECVRLARETCKIILAGNHDLAACGKIDISDFSHHARKAMEWTWDHISLESKTFLATLPSIVTYKGIVLSHGSPRNPVWEYIMSETDALDAFRDVSFTHCFFGHSHLPSAFILKRNFAKTTIQVLYGDGNKRVDASVVNNRFLFNPGSVGFPRDAQDAHASDSLDKAVARFALYDTVLKQWTFRRFTYDMRETGERMYSYGLW
ncbi:metallophosphoesterase family protein [Gracilinema caldarium]|uniref:Metallophosphoesterase n=1 Tax=Gracilinema caldarium (strain ATCC 51460 / DSM 7334 / H1) TaxID=744872 RepID=F8EX87_GRAC1|nr:metallophosphoesterase family protein [Gracilinema caldarium]AEJ18830.1 metallophosphoesterase [Gracilinema caldarium DSM 7334]